MTTRLFFLLTITFICLSCNEQTVNSDAIRTCVKSNTEELLKSIYGENTEIDIYKIAYLLEKEFKKEGFLDRATKDQYISLLNYIHSGKGVHFFENELIREYSSISGLAITPIVLDCPYEVVVREKNDLNSSIVRQLKNAPVLQSTGFSKEAVKDYIEDISDEDFDHMEYRAPVVVIFLFQLQEIFRGID